MNLLARLSLFFLTLITACGQDQAPSTLQQKAVANDPTVKVHKVKDGPAEFYVYVSKGKGYRIDCGADEGGTTRLIESLGISLALLSTSRTFNIDSQEYVDWKVDEQPRLTCQPEGKFLYRMDLQGEEKYFLAEPNISGTRLFNIGCTGLIEAMGFSLNQSYLIPSYLLTDTKVFSAEDSDDLNCFSGSTETVSWELNDAGDVNRNGLCDGLEDCVYRQISSSLLWAKRMDQGLRNWSAAAAYCDKLDYSGFSDWRLPTKDEALKAAQDEMWSEVKATLLNNAPSTWTSTETTDGKSYIVNLSNGNGATFSKTYVSANSVMCVRKQQ